MLHHLCSNQSSQRAIMTKAGIDGSTPWASDSLNANMNPENQRYGHTWGKTVPDNRKEIWLNVGCCVFVFLSIVILQMLCECVRIQRDTEQLQFCKNAQSKKNTQEREREKSSITQLYFRNKGIESAMYVMFWPYTYKWKPAANSGRECLCSDSLSLPQALRDIPGQVTVYTARANHIKDLSLLVRPSPVTLGGWRDTIKLPDRLRGRRRGDWTMRKNLTSVSSQSMAFTDCMKPTDLSTEKKGIK